MKKLVAAASAIALTAGLAFAETHETLKAHTLSTSVGDISFGAWGRSTFNVGRENTTSKITVDFKDAATCNGLMALYAAAEAKYNSDQAAAHKDENSRTAEEKTAAAEFNGSVGLAGKDKYGNSTVQDVTVGKTYTKYGEKANGDETYTGAWEAVYTNSDKVTAVAAYDTASKTYTKGVALKSAAESFQTKWNTNLKDAGKLATANDLVSAGQAANIEQALMGITLNECSADEQDVLNEFLKSGKSLDEAGIKAYVTEYSQTCAKTSGAMALVKLLKDMETDESKSRGFASVEPDWSYGTRVGFWIIGRTPDEKWGFDFNLDADAHALFVHKLWDADEDSNKVNYNEDGKYAVAIGDQTKIWAKFDSPVETETKVAFGKMREQELRGTIGDFGQRESGDVKSEDDIFSEFWPTTGLFVSTKGKEDSVLEGFYAAAAIDLSAPMGISKKDLSTGSVTSRTENPTDTDSSKTIGFYDAMRTGQVGIGYTVSGLVQLKAQYWGDSISEFNYRYARNTYKAARKAGFDMNDYYGRMEFGIDWLGFMGGATSFLDPNLNLSETPNANLIELGFKLPIVTDNDLRDYDPEKFYNWYSCLGTMGVIKQGFIMYKGHVWGGQGTSNLSQYTDVTGSGEGLITMQKGDGANIFMAGVDFLAEVCINPFGKQDVFVGLSGNYNLTSAKADGKFKFGDNTLSVDGLKLQQQNVGAEIYIKKTFAANNFIFAGIADRFTMQSMEGTVENLLDLSYKASNHKFYMPIGVEMFF